MSIAERVRCHFHEALIRLFLSRFVSVVRAQSVSAFVSIVLGGGALGAAHAADSSYRYYCPQSNSTFVSEPKRIDLVSGPYLPFPRTEDDIDRRDEPLRVSVNTQDCSDSEFRCLRIEPGGGLTAVYLFVPRLVELGRMYHFRGMDAVTALATAATSSQVMAQLTIWQRINERQTPIVVTIKAGTGVVFINGPDIWNPLRFEQQRETCILVSDVGLFHTVKVVRPPTSQRPVL